MKRTILPKLLALLLIAITWNYTSGFVALTLCSLIFIALMLVLTIPVMSPRSNFYIATHWKADGASEHIALTFDDGPDPRYTLKILDLLERENIRASFFVVGSRAKAHPDLIQAIISRGHIIGNHSESHSLRFHFSSWKHFHRELDHFDATIKALTGYRCQLFRAPQGFRTPMLADVLKQRDLKCIGWSARGYDAVQSDPRKILKSIRPHLKGGAIVLLHDGGGLGGTENREATIEALPLLIEEIRAKGLRFERLDRLLGVEAYT